jgi:beta-galactosidase
MITKYPPVNGKFPHILHGADYNPEQWKDTPEIWDDDMRMMKLAHCNVVSVGIFSWSSLEPEEGRFTFDWLDNILDKLAENGIRAILATPSGARPAWMSYRYPQVLRVRQNRQRILHGERHNHCYTSPIYREKVQIINRKLAERYKDHPALLVWHVSNEYGGACHCDLCQEAFRAWLKEKYEGDLDKLNRTWWTGFWSHTYTDWSQIQSPARHGEQSLHGLNLDWKRFVTHQTIDFFKNEIVPLKEITPDVPVTTNFMGTFPGLDYWKFARELDVVSWDSYPAWHGEIPDRELGANVGFLHDINRSLKGGKPFMLMESTPSVTNWQPVAKLKRPGMHLLSSLQAVAHGSDTVQYFQWRKSRGAFEKFHGAVVDHYGHEDTRVFRDVTEVGKVLGKLDELVGTTVRPEVAVIYDWENRWAMDDAQGVRREKGYQSTCELHYRAFWNQGIPVDVISEDCDFSGYRLLIAPMLYMVKPGVAKRMEQFVENGGTLVTTYWSGIVDENDLCFLGGFPGPLRRLTGIWSEEIDSLYDGECNFAVPAAGNSLSLKREYRAVEMLDLIHAETAQVLASYKTDFYQGRPALTGNSFGKGKAYYIAFRSDLDFLTDFYTRLVHDLRITKVIDTDLPEGVTAQKRSDEETDYVFLMNFSNTEKTVDLNEDVFRDMLDGTRVEGRLQLSGYGVRVLERKQG